jgi:superfamily II DNA or RNA helicase
LVISDRKDHLKKLSELVLAESAAAAPDILHLDGDLSAKERRSIIARVEQKHAERASVVLFATASLVGEGFDLPTLDTLVLATPLSFKGRMVQYAGRLHRRADGKAEVRVHDYVDASNAMTLKMYRQRVKAYLSMGYEVDAPSDLFARVPPQRSLFPRT